MRKSILVILAFILGMNGCVASDKDDIDNFIKNDFKNYLTDNRKLIPEANKNVKIEPNLKEILFKNTFVKVKTAQSLLDGEYNNWLVGLDKNNFDYTDLNTICWMTVYMQNYIKNMDDLYRKNITEDTRKSVQQFYDMKNKIIKLRDSKDQTLKNFVQVCT